MKRLAVLVLVAATAWGAAPKRTVKAWEGTLTLPVYAEGSPNENPPFDLFATNRFNYPYTLREEITSKKTTERMRALFVENEYVKCSVLPDIGGHLYSCTDKTNGAEMFYANPIVKKAQVGYRGAWAAFGIEFNFPVSHNWVSMSPVDFATVENADGSASVWVANTDRVYGMRWEVELRLRPGWTVLEQRTRLSNPSAVRHRYYWWTNAALEVWDDSRIEYPQVLSASHGFTFVDTWPVNQAGLDLRVVRNHTAGPVSQFTHASREPWMGVYHPKTKAGTAHFAYYDELPAKKIWAWGVDADGLDWRKALSDNESAYVEVQGGLFRNQETYAFLEPRESVEFREFWVPVQETGGITRTTLEAVLHLERQGESGEAALNVTRELRGGRMVVKDGERTLLDERMTLAPGKVWKRALPAGKKYEVVLSAADGAVLLRHVEGQLELKPEEMKDLGPQAPRRLAGDILETGKDHELNGRLLAAWETYQTGVRVQPESMEMKKAAGRLGVQLMRYRESVDLLRAAQALVSNDGETHYYLGLALKGLGQDEAARTQWERALVFESKRAAAALELARLAGRKGDWAEGLKRARQARAGALEVAMLRRLGRMAEARTRLAELKLEDPASLSLRLEAVRLGGQDEAFWRHVGAEPERVLGLAEESMEAGQWAEALALLERKYSDVPADQAEPGMVRPQDYALVAYYRGYCREQLGQSGAADFELGSKQSTRYVFPSRAGTEAVLRAAVKANGRDATALFLLGSLAMSGGRTAEAVERWEEARKLNARIPVLHRNLGWTLLRDESQTARAAEVLRDGLSVDGKNMELYSGLGQALTLLGRPAAERVEMLKRYPEPAAMPAPLVYSLALALAEAGSFAEARQAFAGRFFPREEGGTNVRQVWLEVRVQEARAGRAGVSDVAGAVEGLAFTKDGMNAFLRDARTQYLLGEAEAKAGNGAAAAERWKALAERKGGGLAQKVWMWRAAKKAGLQERAEELRREVAVTLRAGEDPLATPSGAALYGRGLALCESGQADEAKKALRAALLLPDRNLSHYLVREALAATR